MYVFNAYQLSVNVADEDSFWVFWLYYCACWQVGDEDLVVDYDGNLGVVTGWGHTETGQASQVLKEVYIPLVTRAACRETTDYDVTINMICAGATQGTM